jgi:hypothetical protein
MRSHLTAALLVALPALAHAKYDPGEDRAALRSHATAAYEAAANAAGRPLEAAKAAAIKSDLDEAAGQSRLAAEAAKSMETAAGLRADEMDNVVNGRLGSAPEAAAKQATDAAAAGQSRWKTLSKDRDDLKGKVDALPDEKKAKFKDGMDKATAALDGADAALLPAQAGAATMTAGAAQMAALRSRALGPAGERKAADDEVVAAYNNLPPPVAEAKAAVDLLGTEPQAENRTRAGQKLGVSRDVTQRLLAAADRACNRSDDFYGLSKGFDLSRGSYEDGRQAADGKPAAAKALLDQAEAALADVRSRLARN